MPIEPELASWEVGRLGLIHDHSRSILKAGRKMPSPVAHSLVGYCVYQLTAGATRCHHWSLLALYLAVANVPDLDFVPGLLVGHAGRYHHGLTHSIGFAALFGLGVSALLYFYKQAAIRRNFTIFFCLYFSHVILDYLSVDGSAPFGVPLFWPLSSRYYIASFALFPDIQRVSSSTSMFISSLFSLHNFWSVCVELFVLFPFVLLLWAWRRRSEPGRKQ